MLHQESEGDCALEDGPFCFHLSQLAFKGQEPEARSEFAEEVELAFEELNATVGHLWRLSKDARNALAGVVLAEDQYTFALTFKAYANATADDRVVLVDRLLEADFGRQRVILIEFGAPVFLTQNARYASCSSHVLQRAAARGVRARREQHAGAAAGLLPERPLRLQPAAVGARSLPLPRLVRIGIREEAPCRQLLPHQE